MARAARNPALEELFYFGAHPGNFAFEIGNPDLEPEHAFGFDLSLRWRSPRASGEVTYFRNDIRDFVFTAPLTPEEFEEREDEFAERFPGREASARKSAEATEEFPIIEYVGADSVLQGIEAHADFQVTPRALRGAGARLRARHAEGHRRAAAADSAAAVSRRASLSAQRVSGRRRGDRRGEAGSGVLD